jgi:hypothetical protein
MPPKGLNPGLKGANRKFATGRRFLPGLGLIEIFGGRVQAGIEGFNPPE